MAKRWEVKKVRDGKCLLECAAFGLSFVFGGQQYDEILINLERAA
jgi:hypothetical protein